jgi:uncharacterized membrane protein YeaQ/YmgE (transglycosylase-associated protein family)
MNILAWLAVGLVTGWLARQVIKSGDYGLVGDMIGGVTGALLGGALAAALFGGDYMTGINLTTMVLALLGAIILVANLRAMPDGSEVFNGQE